MGNKILIELSCPQCLHAIDVQEHGRHVTCPACNSKFILEGHFCPSCNQYHRQEQGFCSNCGYALTRVCQKCKMINWAGDEFCHDCGAPLDIFHLLHLHTNQATTDRLQKQSEEARFFKEREKEDSAKRMAAFTATEKERVLELARRQAISRKRDQQLLILTGTVLVTFLIVAILLAIL